MDAFISSSSGVTDCAMSLWRCGSRIGLLSTIMTDQPWLFSTITYDDEEFGMQLERASHFLHVLVEEMPDFEDPIEDDLHYMQVLQEEGLQKSLIEGFYKGPWEIRRGNEIEKIQFHSLQNGTLQWRGPQGPVVRKASQR